MAGAAGAYGRLWNLDRADVLEKFGESLKWVMYRFPFGPVPDAGVSMLALVQLSG